MAMKYRLTSTNSYGLHVKSSDVFCFAETSLEAHEHESLEKLFDFVLARPGPGHIEMNAAKVLLQYLWVPLASEVAKHLGFRTPKAQDVFRKGTDHHRSREILNTFLHALSEELLVPYVRQTITPTAQDYLQYVQEVRNETYIFLFHMSFTFLLGFDLYTAAVRKNNSEYMMAARTALVPLFYGKAHTKYQELNLRDLVMRVQAPETLLTYLHNTEAFSKSGSTLGGQGADFVQEETNKEVCSFLPPGVITAEIWRRVCRKTDELTKMKNKLLNCSEVNVSPQEHRYKRHDMEICLVRRLLRESEVLEKPMTYSCPRSVSGKELDRNVGNVKEITRDNYQRYKREVAVKGKYQGPKLIPICISMDERARADSIENKTKSDIVEEMLLIIETMPVEDDAAMYREKVRELKDKSSVKKEKFISMYYEILNDLEEQYSDLDASGVQDQNST